MEHLRQQKRHEELLLQHRMQYKQRAELLIAQQQYSSISAPLIHDGFKMNEIPTETASEININNNHDKKHMLLPEAGESDVYLSHGVQPIKKVLSPKAKWIRHVLNSICIFVFLCVLLEMASELYIRFTTSKVPPRDHHAYHVDYMSGAFYMWKLLHAWKGRLDFSQI